MKSRKATGTSLMEVVFQKYNLFFQLRNQNCEHDECEMIDKPVTYAQAIRPLKFELIRVKLLIEMHY